MHQEGSAKNKRHPKQQSGWPYLYRETFRSESNSAHRTLSRSKHRGVSTPVAGPVSGSLLMLERIYTSKRKMTRVADRLVDDCRRVECHLHDASFWLGEF